MQRLEDVAAAIFLAFMLARTPQEDVSGTDVPAVELRRADELERRRVASARRQEMRDHIIRELIAGRITLLQASDF